MYILKKLLVVVVTGLFLASFSTVALADPDAGEPPQPPPENEPGTG